MVKRKLTMYRPLLKFGSILILGSLMSVGLWAGFQYKGPYHTGYINIESMNSEMLHQVLQTEGCDLVSETEVVCRY